MYTCTTYNILDPTSKVSSTNTNGEENAMNQGPLVLWGRNIAKHLSKVAWFFVLKKCLREQIGGVTYF